MVPMNMNVVEKGKIWETCGGMFVFELHTLQEYTDKCMDHVLHFFKFN